jgi:hypothetical protein
MLDVWSRRKKSDHALLSVYLRPDAFYVVAYGTTSTGLWSYSGAPAVTLGLECAARQLGAAVVEALSLTPVSLRHPSDQADWTAHRRQALTPLQRQAGVRSWRAFLSPAKVVHVRRQGATVTVTPYKPDPKRRDAHVSVEEHAATLTAPDAQALGSAIEIALTHAPSYS